MTFTAKTEDEFLLIAESDEPAAGEFAIAYALLQLTYAIHRLGTNDAATNMGGLEAVAKEIGALASAVSALGEK